MKRFEFSLETVRRWRLEQEGIEELKLRQMLAEKQNLSATRIRIITEMGATARQVLGQASIESLELESLDSFRLHSRSRVRDLEKKERECETRIAEQRNRVLEARRQFELLDRLRLKALSEWRAAGNKEQEEMAAELFLAKSVRARNRTLRSRREPRGW